MHIPTWSEISREELEYLYTEKGLTTAEIGERFGVTGEAVRHRMARLGLARRGQPWSDCQLRDRLTGDALRQLYVDQGRSMAEIAHAFGVAETTVLARLKKCRINRRDLSAACIHYPRRDFSGDPHEKAYLVGFRQGDLWAGKTNDGPYSTSISIACVSSRPEQIQLFESLFSPYGHVAVTRGRNGPYVQYSLQCCVNWSFDFLLPKQDEIPPWVLDDPQLFTAFLAGYIDAEGSFQLNKDGTSRFCLASYDSGILHQVSEVLADQFAIHCEAPHLTAPKGRVMSGGYRSNGDLWTLAIGSKRALYRLCTLVEPYLKHAKRRHDMAAVQRNVMKRGVVDTEQS